jgi:DNA-binding winged helix-turn-helix (wHTH) protein
MLAGDGRSVYATGECEVDVARRELRVFGAPVPIGGRAFEIVEALAQSAGELVTKDKVHRHRVDVYSAAGVTHRDVQA